MRTLATWDSKTAILSDQLYEMVCDSQDHPRLKRGARVRLCTRQGGRNHFDPKWATVCPDEETKLALFMGVPKDNIKPA